MILKISSIPYVSKTDMVPFLAAPNESEFIPAFNKILFRNSTLPGIPSRGTE